MRTKRNIKLNDLIQTEREYYLKICNFNKNNKEYDIFNLLCDGCTRVEISDKVNLSIDTVSSRTNKIYIKVEKAIKR